MSFVYKIAETPLEFEQIHRLNYETFVEEIPQHNRNETRVLLDKFHDENTYVICLKDNQVIGMLAARSNRPFSLDGKIGKIERHLPFEVHNPVEIRLLAVEKTYRNGRVFLGMVQALVRYCLKAGFDSAFISGTVREQKLYGQLGFMPFAHLTGTDDAAFQPMYLTKETFEAGVAGRISKAPVNFLPGPATISDQVQTAIMANPYSHRSHEFENLLQRVNKRLTTLTGAKYVQLLHGTGTLANDVVAAQLSVHGGRGLILVNGEFGSRLTDHATRMGLDFDSLEVEWGCSFDSETINDALTTDMYTWLWAVQCETSTGVLNDLAMLKELCEEHGVVLAIDSVSAIGAMPVDLKGVAYASGVSGKGILSYTGLSFVFHNEEVYSNKTLPRYLDLGTYAEKKGIPYSQSTNLVAALDVALQKYDNASEVFTKVEERYRKIRAHIQNLGLTVLAPKNVAASAIMTIEMPDQISATRLGENLYINGFDVHYESRYLMARNWLQIACINELSNRELDKMLEVLYILITSSKIEKGDGNYERIANN